MAESQDLTGIERELVIRYLRDDNVPLTITLEEKPEMEEVALSGEKTGFPEDEKRVPTSCVFPVAIPARQLEVLDQGVILLKNAARTVQPFLGKQVRVQFYFNRLGLYFITTMKECSKGLAIVVPSAISRIPDVVHAVKYDFMGSLSYKVHGDKVVSIDCLPLSGFRIFAQPKWSDISPDCQKSAKSLLEKFVSDIKNGSSKPLDNGLHLISVAGYLSRRVFPALDQAVEGRCMPFNMIYCDEKRIILAASEGCEVLDNDIEYSVSLDFTLQPANLVHRKIECSCEVENVYCGSDEKVKCYAIRYKTLKKEDHRFLYERVAGRLAG